MITPEKNGSLQGDDGPLRLALVGMRHNHANAMVRYAAQSGNVKLIAVVEDDPELRASAVEKLQLPCYENVNTMLANENVEAASVVTVNSKKLETAITCMQAGLHVIIDNPMVTEMQQLKSLEDALRETGCVAMLMMTLRFSPVYVTARRLILEGAIGSLVQASLRLPHHLRMYGNPWRFDRTQYGGLIAHLGIHHIDMFRWITGANRNDIQHMAAFHGNYGRSGHDDFEDSAHILIRLKDGTVGNFETGWLAPSTAPSPRDVNVFTGIDGTLTIDNANNRLVLTKDDSSPHEVPLDTTRRMGDDFLTGIRQGADAMIAPPKEAIESTAWTLLARAEADRAGRFER